MWEIEQAQGTAIRVWDRNWELLGELPIEAKSRNEGHIDLPVDHPIAQWILEHTGHGVYLTVDSSSGRWCGYLDQLKVVKPPVWFHEKVVTLYFVEESELRRRLAV